MNEGICLSSPDISAVEGAIDTASHRLDRTVDIKIECLEDEWEVHDPVVNRQASSKTGHPTMKLPRLLSPRVSNVPSADKEKCPSRELQA